MATKRTEGYDPVSIEEIKRQTGFDRIIADIITKQRQRKPLDCDRVYREVIAEVNPGMHVVFDGDNLKIEQERK